PQSLGKALVNLLPLEQGEWITSILPLPEDRETWSELELMFATKTGNVRRNALADFENINRNGKIAMKLDEGDQIINVETCTPNQNVLLTTSNGQCIRFPVTDVRVFKGRDSTGVRGIRLEDGNEVISMTILNGVDASPAERTAYVKQAAALRRAEGDDDDAAGNGDGVPAVEELDVEDGADAPLQLTAERFAELADHEQMVFTVSTRGFGKRSSSYEYRTSGRGGKGILAMVVNDRNGKLAASFPLGEQDQIMLVTNAGKLIRCPVGDIRIAGRNTQGVRIFRTDQEEQVVSVERIRDVDDDEASDEDSTATDSGTGDATEPAPDANGPSSADPTSEPEAPDEAG
ncbi:MAG: DNA gyrase C-terminal beta-propeller domain-containing protein, partial [Pseudomonadota bacterium]